MLPTYLPKPLYGPQWYLRHTEIQNGAFKTGIAQSDSDSMGTYYGSLSENIGKPSVQECAQPYLTSSCPSTAIQLPNGIVGKKYAGSMSETAISWEQGSWSFFVDADSNYDGGAVHFAQQIIHAVNGSNPTLPGPQGSFYLIMSGAKALTQIDWKSTDGVWYELVWNKDISDAIKVLQSMAVVEKK